ncbi:PREDICTED: uncharacterized protein LOC108572142 [Habropoda laboriosa]|uniref:uncharacterized protein LOC108572142 n=1 Tax=Habropoda laboriosa TaxID=597456 RepID=UPI00083D315F|nr:PREDICTED: uncharacterized protein LOC108572142 [Habropoda laboriosa]
MAAKIQLLFPLFLSALIVAALASPLDDAANDNGDCNKASANINKLFDIMLPTLKDVILKHKLDPMRLQDISENLEGPIIHKRILNLTNGWFQGLSDVQRAKDVILTFENKVLTVDATIGFDALGVKYDYLFKDLLISRTGIIHGRLRNMEIRVVVGLDMNTYKIILPTLQIQKIEQFVVTLEGHKLDPILNAAVKAFTTIFRKKVTSMVEKEVLKVVRFYVEQINENIPKPDRLHDNNDILDYVPASFLFRLV